MSKVFFYLPILFLSLNSFGQASSADSTVYRFCEQPAEYLKRDTELIRNLSEYLKFKTASIDEAGCSKIIISFIIEIDSSISNIHFPKPTKLLDLKEVEQSFKLLSKFKPAQNNSIPVRSLYTVPIHISYE